MHPVIKTAKENARNLLEPEALELFKEYNLPVPSYQMVTTGQEAVKAAAEIGFPVVLKIVSSQIIHKSETGGVKVGLNSPEEVATAWDAIQERIGEHVGKDAIEGMIVCEQVDKELECILGMTKDPQFGPALMFGLGGIFVELIKDVSFRVLPIDRDDAREMVEETKAFQLIRGLRGSAPKDMDSVIEFIMNCGRMIAENPEIAELDVNPLAVLEKGVVALDARVLL